MVTSSRWYFFQRFIIILRPWFLKIIKSHLFLKSAIIKKHRIYLLVYDDTKRHYEGLCLLLDVPTSNSAIYTMCGRAKEMYFSWMVSIPSLDLRSPWNTKQWAYTFIYYDFKLYKDLLLNLFREYCANEKDVDIR
jgi:hypothetical protein